MSTDRATLLDSESMAQEHPLTFTPSRLHRVEGIARTLMKGLRGTRLPACRNTSKSREQGYIELGSIPLTISNAVGNRMSRNTSKKGYVELRSVPLTVSHCVNCTGQPISK